MGSGKLELPFGFLDLSLAVGLPVTVVPFQMLWTADSLQVWQTGIPFSFLNLWKFCLVSPPRHLHHVWLQWNGRGLVMGSKTCQWSRWVTSEGERHSQVLSGLFHTCLRRGGANSVCAVSVEWQLPCLPAVSRECHIFLNVFLLLTSFPSQTLELAMTWSLLYYWFLKSYSLKEKLPYSPTAVLHITGGFILLISGFKGSLQPLQENCFPSCIVEDAKPREICSIPQSGCTW